MLITGCFVRFAPVSIDVSLAEELLDINHGIQVISADSRTLQRRCHTINIPIISALYAMCENVFVLNTDFHTTEESLPFPGTYVFAKFVSSWLVHCRVKPNLHDDFAMLDELGTMLFCRVWAKKGMVVRWFFSRQYFGKCSPRNSRILFVHMAHHARTVIKVSRGLTNYGSCNGSPVTRWRCNFQRCAVPTSDESCGQTSLKIGSRQCAAAFSLQIPMPCTDPDSTLLYISKWERKQIRTEK